MEKRRRRKKFEWMMRRWILHKYDTSIHSIYRNKYLVLYLKKRSMILQIIYVTDFFILVAWSVASASILYKHYVHIYYN
jgi:hypothetical protein